MITDLLQHEPITVSGPILPLRTCTQTNCVSPPHLPAVDEDKLQQTYIKIRDGEVKLRAAWLTVLVPPEPVHANAAQSADRRESVNRGRPAESVRV